MATTMPAQNSQSGGSFSALTLFECTITNATMLVDSMPLKELVLALRIIANLQNHVVDVLDPVAVQAADTVEEHQLCPPKVAMVAPVGPVGTSKLETKIEKQDLLIKEEMFDEDDDIQILDGDDSSFTGDASFYAYDTTSYTTSQATASKKPRISSSSTVSDTSYSTGNDLTGEWKQHIRNAYKQLKEETNSNVFDFSVPYSARVNSEAANLVIQKTCEMTGFKPTNTAHFRKLSFHYIRDYYNFTLKRSAQFMNKRGVNRCVTLFTKLNRRQKSFEALKPTLPNDSRAKLELILNKDYTSSDEEGSADLDGDVRVKELPWESQELSQMKKTLDDYFYENLANAKEKQEMSKLKKTGALKSSRPPPNDNFFWAKK